MENLSEKDPSEISNPTFRKLADYQRAAMDEDRIEELGAKKVLGPLVAEVDTFLNESSSKNMAELYTNSL